MAELTQQYGSILPCGGKGTRLASLSGDALPKSLFKVGGKELIRHTTDMLDPKITPTLIFAIGHHREKIKEWVTKASLPHKIQFSEQDTPGVLGAISAGAQLLTQEGFIACNTDEVRSGLNVYDALAFHETHDALATMVVTRSADLSRHRLIQIDENSRIVSTQLKPIEYRDKKEKTGLINAGFLIMSQSAVNYFDPSHSQDWSGLIDPLCDAGQLYGYIDENFRYFNVGTPQEYQEADLYLEQNTRQGN